jgi:DNA replicative helicase MCM subunit Mcm2 (Cdc46/Mcm family)
MPKKKKKEEKKEEIKEEKKEEIKEEIKEPKIVTSQTCVMIPVPLFSVRQLK